ncbi:hypothetical protein UFOVP1666_109 [uncultured Caudovirales phage]|uniref:Uncharacterized protein n=1 Tax=uncultured Caudovirales phage TaxID=2100421 RepID=A0A6J5PNV3_9CAUD|nr:hypothetical protein UFOVP867_64 [uncultured Caudovirales phage]CAB4170885.1 hypothetical protein UFOVP913_134 [uncultured Caudovirales phage]CAB4177132.1 hypothetical protein UFOVP993_187 [uncultured Caudovirales phage]CAB4223066.1 hypothetical protein UFOVP1666_109 [uncultured Caudovirales phage]
MINLKVLQAQVAAARMTRDDAWNIACVAWADCEDARSNWLNISREYESALKESKPLK